MLLSDKGSNICAEHRGVYAGLGHADLGHGLTGDVYQCARGGQQKTAVTLICVASASVWHPS